MSEQADEPRPISVQIEEKLKQIENARDRWSRAKEQSSDYIEMYDVPSSDSCEREAMECEVDIERLKMEYDELIRRANSTVR